MNGWVFRVSRLGRTRESGSYFWRDGPGVLCGIHRGILDRRGETRRVASGGVSSICRGGKFRYCRGCNQVLRSRISTLCLTVFSRRVGSVLTGSCLCIIRSGRGLPSGVRRLRRADEVFTTLDPERASLGPPPRSGLHNGVKSGPRTSSPQASFKAIPPTHMALVRTRLGPTSSPSACDAISYLYLKAHE